MLPGAVGSAQEALEAAKEDELEQLLWQVARGQVSISAAVDFLETEPEQDLAEKRFARRWSQQTRTLTKPTPTTVAPAQVIQRSKAPQCAQVVVEAYEENDPLCAGCRVRDHQLKALAQALRGLANAALSLSGLSLPKQELARLVLDHCSPCSHLEVGIGTLCASLHAAVKDSQRQEPKVFSEALPPSKVTPLRDPSPIAAAEREIGALSPTRFPRARPVPPYQDSDSVQFHDLQVAGVEVQVQRSPNSTPAALLRMPELSPQPRPSPPRSPRRAASPYELATRGPHRAEPDRSLEDAAGAWIHRSAPKPTQRADMLFDLPQPGEAPPLLPKPQGRASPHQAPHEAMAAKALRQQTPHEEPLPAAEPVAKAQEVPATDAPPTDVNVAKSQPDVALPDHSIPAPPPAPSGCETQEVAVAPNKVDTDASGADGSAPAPKSTTLVSADEEGAHLAPAARKTVSLGDLPETQSSADGQAPQKMERQNARSLSVFASLPGYTKEFASSAGLEISPLAAHISPSAGGLGLKGKGEATREVENASSEPSAKPPSTDSPAPPGKPAATEPSARAPNKDAPAPRGEPAAAEASAKPPSSELPASAGHPTATEPSAKPASKELPAPAGHPTATEPSAKPASKDALLPDGQSVSPEPSKTEPAKAEPSTKARKSAPQGGLPPDADIADWRKHSSGALSDSVRPVHESAPVVASSATAPKAPAASEDSPETVRASSDAAAPNPLQKEERKEDAQSSSEESDSSDGSEPSAPPENKSKALHQVQAPAATDRAPAAIRKSLPDRLQEAPRAGSLRLGNGPMRAGSLSFKGTPKAFARP